jgi:hypothetical protein
MEAWVYMTFEEGPKSQATPKFTVSVDPSKDGVNTTEFVPVQLADGEVVQPRPLVEQRNFVSP